MLRDNLGEIRTEAKRLGIPWSWVCQLKNELVECQALARAATSDARQAAWFAYVGRNSGSAPFWRHGFRARFARRLAAGCDFTIVPCYDEIADAVREQVDEYSGWETAEIWEFLLSDYQPWPERATFYWEAIEEIGSSDCGTRNEKVADVF